MLSQEVLTTTAVHNKFDTDFYFHPHMLRAEILKTKKACRTAFRTKITHQTLQQHHSEISAII
jgi:hypothetical protein